MQQKPIYTLLATIAALLIIVGAGILFFKKNPGPVSDSGVTATSTSSTSSSTNMGNTNTSGASSGGSAQITLDTPDYMKPIAFSSDISEDTRAQLNASLKPKQDALKKNPLDLNAWLSMGAVRKIGGDYAGAAEDWEYVLSITTNNKMALANLGDLYQNWIKDYPKAESYYLDYLKIDTHNVDIYADLYTMYRFQYKTNTTLAADILTKGLTENPGDQRLLSLQSDLQQGN